MLKEGQNQVTRYVIDDLVLDIKRCELRRDESPVPLPKLSFDLLACLAESAPALMSPSEIMAKVWQGRVIGDETLKQRVKLLRKALGDNASDPKYIEVVRGQGYRLVPAVKAESVVNQPPSVMLDLAANDHFPSITGIQQHKWWQRISLFAFTLLMVFFASILMTTPSLDRTNKSMPSELDRFAGISSEAQKKYQTGREYYDRYRRTDNDIAIEMFTQAINLEPEFSAAYAYLSRAYSQRLYQFEGSENDKQLAIDNAYLALAFDSDSPEAYKALGTAYYVSGWLSKSINANLRAFERDEHDLDIASNLAFIYSEQGQYDSALFWHKKALAIQPDSAVAQLHFAITLQRIGEFRDAAIWYERALASKPDYLLAIKHNATLFIEESKVEKAVTYLLHKLERFPNHPMLLDTLVKAYVYLGEFEKASQAVEQLSALGGSIHNSAHVLLILYSRNQLSQTGEITRISAELMTKQRQGNEHSNVSFLLGQLALFTNDHKQMIRYWIQAIEQGMVKPWQYYQVLTIAGQSVPVELERKLSSKVNEIKSAKTTYQNMRSAFDIPN